MTRAQVERLPGHTQHLRRFTAGARAQAMGQCARHIECVSLCCMLFPCEPDGDVHAPVLLQAHPQPDSRRGYQSKHKLALDLKTANYLGVRGVCATAGTYSVAVTHIALLIDCCTCSQFIPKTRPLSPLKWRGPNCAARRKRNVATGGTMSRSTPATSAWYGQ